MSEEKSKRIVSWEIQDLRPTEACSLIVEGSTIVYRSKILGFACLFCFVCRTRTRNAWATRGLRVGPSTTHVGPSSIEFIQAGVLCARRWYQVPWSRSAGRESIDGTEMRTRPKLELEGVDRVDYRSFGLLQLLVNWKLPVTLYF